MLLKQERETLEVLEKMLEKGYSDYEELSTYEDLSSLQDDRRFQQLLKTYFPDKF